VIQVRRESRQRRVHWSRSGVILAKTSSGVPEASTT
jgi:hypothetical protein